MSYVIGPSTTLRFAQDDRTACYSQDDRTACFAQNQRSAAEGKANDKTTLRYSQHDTYGSIPIVTQPTQWTFYRTVMTNMPGADIKAIRVWTVSP